MVSNSCSHRFDVKTRKLCTLRCTNPEQHATNLTLDTTCYLINANMSTDPTDCRELRDKLNQPSSQHHTSMVRQIRRRTSIHITKVLPILYRRHHNLSLPEWDSGRDPRPQRKPLQSVRSNLQRLNRIVHLFVHILLQRHEISAWMIRNCRLSI